MFFVLEIEAEQAGVMVGSAQVAVGGFAVFPTLVEPYFSEFFAKSFHEELKVAFI